MVFSVGSAAERRAGQSGQRAAASAPALLAAPCPDHSWRGRGALPGETAPVSYSAETGCEQSAEEAEAKLQTGKWFCDHAEEDCGHFLRTRVASER